MIDCYSKRFVDQLVIDGDKVSLLSFEKMCKFFGKEFMDYLEVSWKANGGSMTEIEFCEYNLISIDFFNKRIK